MPRKQGRRSGVLLIYITVYDPSANKAGSLGVALAEGESIKSRKLTVFLK